MKKNINPKSPTFIFALLTLAAYGLLVPFTGFYWDDWPFAWIAKFQGAYEFIPGFLPFRPFLGPIFYVTTSLIPLDPIYWQIFAVVIRFIMGVSLWWSLGKVFPEKKQFPFIAALLFIVFPGYSQHWVALTHINQELIPFIFYILSFGFTFKALQESKLKPPSSAARYTIIAILLQICGIYPTEYFFPLESLRFLLLFFFFFEGNLITRFISTMKAWWAYLLVWVSNAAWLIYYYRFGPYNSYEANALESVGISNLFIEILDTVWKACFYIWIQIFTLLAKSITAPTSLLTIGLIIVSFIILTRLLPLINSENENKTFAIYLIITGFISILLGRIPSLAAGLPLRLQTGYDRFMVSMMIGSILFAIGIIELFIRNSKTKSYVYITLIALGIGQQFYTGNVFRRDWEKQKEFYWQITSRIPALEPNTVLLTYQLPTEYEPDLSYTGPINWMYAPDFSPADNLPYALIFTEKRIGGSTLPSLAPASPIRFNYRTVLFDGSTSQAVVIYMPINGCVRVLDPSRGDANIYSKEPDELVQAIPLSNPSLIITNPETPAIPSFLNEEVPVNWCAYFTKAELAHQLDDYETTINLFDEATAIGYQSEDLNEWLIYIDSLARIGEVDSAKEKSLELLNQNPRMKRGVCVVWKKLEAQGINQAVEFGCQ